MEKLKQQIDFILEIDKLKTILRQTRIIANTKHENDAEHSWHLAMMAIILQEHANFPVDITKVIKMVLIHDIVEIDAGDVFLYDEKGMETKEENEIKAAERIFGILPPDQKKEMIELWQEFEAKVTNEAKFAASLDRLAPLLLNHKTGGYTWKKHNVTSDKVYNKLQEIENGSEILWDLAKEIIQDSIDTGLLKK